YGPALLKKLSHAAMKTASIERFNLLSDSFALAQAGLMPAVDYLDLTARFTVESDRNVWTTLNSSLAYVNRVIRDELRGGLAALVAAAGDEPEYAEFRDPFKTARTPQEEQRYLYALAGFRQAELLSRTLEMTLNGEIRSQDAPYVIRSLLTSVYGRRLAWDFIKGNWQAMARQYPESAYTRMYEGIAALVSVEWERDVRAFFAENKIDLGGKTLQQSLEQLRV